MDRSVETAHTEFVVDDASPLEHRLGSLAASIDGGGHLVAKGRGMIVRGLDVGVEQRAIRAAAAQPRSQQRDLFSVRADGETWYAESPVVG